jgi:hypothetical protein
MKRLYMTFLSQCTPKTTDGEYEIFLEQLDPIIILQISKNDWRRHSLPNSLINNFFFNLADFLSQVSGCDLDDLTPQRKQATIDDLRRLVALWGPLLTSWKITHELLDLEDVRRH